MLTTWSDVHTCGSHSVMCSSFTAPEHLSPIKSLCTERGIFHVNFAFYVASALQNTLLGGAHLFMGALLISALRYNDRGRGRGISREIELICKRIQYHLNFKAYTQMWIWYVRHPYLLIGHLFFNEVGDIIPHTNNIWKIIWNESISDRMYQQHPDQRPQAESASVRVYFCICTFHTMLGWELLYCLA